MTLRALIIGILGAVIFGAGGRYLEVYVPGPALIRGHLPVSVFGLLIFFVIVINPLITTIKRNWRFRPGEIALILALLLSVSAIVDAGLLRFFPSMAVYPMHLERTMPGWQRLKILDYVPDALLANDGQYSTEVVENYISVGDPVKLNRASLKNSFDRVPWAAWKKPLAFWGVVIGLTFVAVVALSVIVHRQWARRERIRYPLAEIASSLLVLDDRGRTAILRNKIFWLGFAIPMFIYMVNMSALWYPGAITIPLDFRFEPIAEAFPELMKVSGSRYFHEVWIYPAAVGIGFLLASDIGFSLAVANPITVFVLYLLINRGVDVSGGFLQGGYKEWQTFGSYLAFALMLLYIGRRYYWQTAKQALAFIPQQEADSASVWGMRILTVSLIGIMTALIYVGLAWHLAILAVLFTMMAFFVLARLNAEAGTFFSKPSWFVPGVLLGLYGFEAIGPVGYIIICLLMYALSGDPFECLMPFAVNGMKITGDTGMKVGKVGLVMGATLLLTLSIAIPFTIWADYQNAAVTLGGNYSREAYNHTSRNIEKMASTQLEQSISYSSWERLTNIRPESKFIVSAAVGFALVLVLAAVRLRYTWWPFHPLIMLTFGDILMVGKYGASFMLGWFIKAAVTRLAGASKYIEIRPLMIGVIVGHLASGFVTMCILWAYYVITGSNAPPWRFW